MVWFQCEDCGENLKKPKLPNHFRVCSANKLSCIDCGQIFGQQSVQGHTQCITEAEKYGPKGQGKTPNGKPAKPNNDSNQKPDVDINVGLSERPPWFCSICKTKATSKQTLLLHADGKKHRAKARAFQVANQQPKLGEGSTLDAKESIGSDKRDELPDNNDTEAPKNQSSVKAGVLADSSKTGNGNSLSSKKRSLDASNDVTGEMARADMPSELGNGEVIQVERREEETKQQKKKAKQCVTEEDNKLNPGSVKEAKKKIKWKKLIKSALKSSPSGMLKMKKLRKLVQEALRESGFTEDESQINDMIEWKINSSSKFMIDDKYVRLVSQN